VLQQPGTLRLLKCVGLFHYHTLYVYTPHARTEEEDQKTGQEKIGKTGVTADRDKMEFRLFNSSSIFNITLREELFSLPK